MCRLCTILSNEQVANLMEVEELLLKAGLEYIKQCVIEEDGIKVTQVCFSGVVDPPMDRW